MKIKGFSQDQADAADELVRLGYATRERRGGVYVLTLTPAGIAYRDALLKQEPKP